MRPIKTDMEAWPASLSGCEGAFCLVSGGAEVATVFVFSHDSNCLTTAMSFYEDNFTSMVI